MSYYYKPYVTVAQKKAKAEKKLAQLRKKNPDIRPVAIEGTALAKTWWGKAWNKNLESYADYANRIGRGRSYVRHSAVLDLKIGKERIDALVQGSEAKPYEVSIRIQPIAKKTWERIKEACMGDIESLAELREGKFPKALGNIFTAQGTGLFPSPSEISLSCSCPDWAKMCKHVAATLYGVGARLDEDPMLFFTLRNVDAQELVAKAVEDQKKKLLTKAETKSSRVLENVDLSSMFDIDLEGDDETAASEKASEKKKIAPKSKAKKDTREKTKAKAKPVGKKKSATEKPTPNKRKEKAAPAEKTTTNRRKGKAAPAEKTTTNRRKGKAGPAEKNNPRKTENAAETLNAPYATVAEIVENAIPKTSKGTDIAAIVEKTGFDSIKVYNALARLKKAGKIENAGRGLYRKKK